MTKIDIKESEGGGGVRTPSSKSPSPARREAGLPNNHDLTDKSAKNDNIDHTKNSDKNREGVSNESGYFEEDDDSNGLQQEDSIEIIFDKNASNNNSGQSSNPTGRPLSNILSLLITLYNAPSRAYKMLNKYPYVGSAQNFAK